LLLKFIRPHQAHNLTQLTTNHSLSVHNITIHFRQSIIIIIIIIITNHGESACVEPLCHQPGATGGGAHRRNKGIEGEAKSTKKHSKKSLSAAYEWSQEEVLFADTVMAFCKEYLFPRYKFLDDKWTENNSREDARSFSALVSR